MKKKEDLPDCPVATTLQILGSKWKLFIIKDLLVRPWRFNELKNDLDGISQKVLTQSLRSMEEDGIIVRREIESRPPKIVEYSLSPLGETLRPLIDEMRKWGNYYKTQVTK
ncbi:winged helix-turn-helix transcriptional regulator [Treponema parvum]|uniref:winged helix-turn-helix transcriptional regulator n=1 Tax=Treponema parvum TaxID=138851 RepID=UPI001AEC6B9E|nr:helix-turn-helix domain-containing protein [Treponema parvum]QTQ17223.1 helix-turn-helix transcriptional regulator [Treponema parvum]